MKIIFAADTSFHYFGKTYPGDDIAVRAMGAVASRMKRADFSVINLETAFGHAEAHTPIKKSGPNQISLPEFAKYIEVLAPAAASLANNHAGDYGAQPIFDTQRILAEMGIRSFGAGANLEEAYRGAVLEKDGERVCVIGVCENEFGTATEKSAGSAGYSLARVTKVIGEAKENGCACVVFFHGGNEHYAFPSPRKKELYRHFIDIGASAVIAMHTHCPQGYEVYRGAPIVYSMGNFYFPAPTYPDKPRYAVWAYGYMAELSFRDGKASIEETVPYRQSFDGITLLEGEERAEFERYLSAISAPIADDARLQRYFDAWCVKAKPLNGIVKYDPDTGSATPSVRNLLSCEAHNEALATEARVRFEGRAEEAASLIPDIRALQELQIPDSLA